MWKDGIWGCPLAHCHWTSKVGRELLESIYADHELIAELKAYARSIGRVLLIVPCPLQIAEDAKVLLTRNTVHPASFRICFLEPWVQDLHDAFFTAGTLDKVAVLKWEEKHKENLSPEIKMWTDQVFQQIYHMVTLQQMEAFNYPLLIDNIPTYHFNYFHTTGTAPSVHEVG
jgi:hypothetical protein